MALRYSPYSNSVQSAVVASPVGAQQLNNAEDNDVCEQILQLSTELSCGILTQKSKNPTDLKSAILEEACADGLSDPILPQPVAQVAESTLLIPVNNDGSKHQTAQLYEQTLKFGNDEVGKGLRPASPTTIANSPETKDSYLDLNANVTAEENFDNSLQTNSDILRNSDRPSVIVKACPRYRANVEQELHKRISNKYNENVWMRGVNTPLRDIINIRADKTEVESTIPSQFYHHPTGCFQLHQNYANSMAYNEIRSLSKRGYVDGATTSMKMNNVDFPVPLLNLVYDFSRKLLNAH